MNAFRHFREQPVEKTVIDRCVRLVYRDYLADPKPEKMPILEDLYNALLKQEEKEAHYIATALSLIRFEKLPKLSASDTVISASMQLRQYSSTSTRYVGVYEVLKDWDSETANWNNFNPDDPANISTEAVECRPGSDSSWSVMEFDVTNLYRKWCTKDASGNRTNHGVALRTPAHISGTNYTILYSSEKSGEAYRPTLYVNYVSHAGIEGWWQYEQMSAGRAGTVYADLFNGNVILEHADTAMSGSRMPVSVSHYYNSCLSKTNDFHCGYGWKTSAHQQVDAITLDDLEYHRRWH